MSGEPPAEKRVRCRNCGNMTPMYGKFCIYCGMKMLPTRITQILGISVGALLMSMGILLIASMIMFPMIAVYMILMRTTELSREVFLTMVALMAGSELVMILAIFFYFDNWRALLTWIKMLPSGRSAAVRSIALGSIGGVLCSAVVTFIARCLHLGIEVEVQLVPTDILVIFAAMLIVGLSEEFLFRGFMQQALTLRLGFWKALLISSAVFAVVHVDVRIMPIIFALGILLGMVYEKSGRTLAAPMAFHALYNTFQVIFPILLSF